eukprot:1872457-Alexandrium_andersonii.AAC.1
MDHAVVHFGLSAANWSVTQAATHERTVMEVEWVVVQFTVPVTLFFAPAAPFMEQATHEAGHRELHA